MGNTGNYSGDTEEIFIDEEEFEAMLASERERAQTVKDSFSEGETVIEYIDDDDYPDIDGVDGGDCVGDDIPDDDYADDNTVIYSKADIEDYVEEPEPEYVAPAPKKSKKANKYNNMDASEDEFEFEDEGEEENGIVNIFAGGFGDKLIYLTGALIILFALIVGVVLITAKTRKNIAGPDMGDIGLSVTEINLIGEEGLNNVFGHEAARLTDLYEAAESFEYSEVDEETGLVNVDLALTSILKDLKVKFVNKNNKLVAGVPFQAEVTDSKGNTKIYTDDDKDGIIYLTDLAGGEYSVKIVKLSGFDALYSFNESKATIKVKDQIEYAKVDVSNEVKKESQVDVKKEDTKVNETVEESKLPDTVEFVISKQESLTDPSGYTEISKDKVKNPMDQYTSQNSAKAGKFMKLENDVSPNNPSPTYSVNSISVADNIAGGTNSSASVDVTGSISDVSWTSSDASLQITKDANDAKKANIVTSAVTSNTSVTITATVTFENGTSASASKTVTVTADASYFDGAGSVGVLYPGTSIDLSKVITYTIKDKAGNTPSGYTISYSSNNTAVVSVSGSTITGVAAGTAKITATCTADNMTTKTKEFDVTVSTSNVKVKLNYSKLTIFYDGGDSVSLAATVEGTVNDKTVTWTSSDEGVVTVSDSGALTAHKAGSATVTCTSKEDKKVSATCTITAVQHPSKDTTQLLKDTEGNQLYVKNGNSFVEAKFADYYNGSKLYKATKVEYKYTGWWTIGGKTYYFDKNGNKVTGEQVILGTKYNFASDESIASRSPPSGSASARSTAGRRASGRRC